MTQAPKVTLGYNDLQRVDDDNPRVCSLISVLQGPSPLNQSRNGLQIVKHKREQPRQNELGARNADSYQ